MTTYFSADHGALVVGDIYTNKLKTILRVYLYPCNKFILHSHSTISNDKIPTEFNNMHIFADDDRKHSKDKALNLLKAKNNITIRGYTEKCLYRSTLCPDVTKLIKENKAPSCSQ